MAGSTVIKEWLRQVPLFSACSARELRAIAGVVKEVNHAEGTVVATEGDPGIGLFVIIDGEAEVTIGGKRMAGAKNVGVTVDCSARHRLSSFIPGTASPESVSIARSD